MQAHNRCAIVLKNKEEFMLIDLDTEEVELLVSWGANLDFPEKQDVYLLEKLENLLEDCDEDCECP